MFYRLFPFTVLMLMAAVVFGQTPQNIQLDKSEIAGGEKAACPDQYAGTIQFANFIGQSNDTIPDTIYLCLNDAFDIIHNGDADLTGDPNPATTPGITYAWFDCPPTIQGPNLTTILTEPCIFDGPPPPANGIYVTASGNINGNINFNNSGALQSTFNGGDPILFWFAPITIDNFSLKLYENDAGGETGPCVNLNTDEAFAVVYLNEVELSNFDGNAGVSGCEGSITVEGGLPEFDGSDYDVTISLVGNPSVMGTVTNGAASHGDDITFQVPAPGLYEIRVEDGKSCGGSFVANMTSCVNLGQSISSSTNAPGDNVCLEVVSENGFADIQSIQYAITWDGTILQYTGVTNITPLLPSLTQSAFNYQNDTLRMVWFESLGGATVPDGTVLFEICFDVIGADGECTDVSFVNLGPLTSIEVFDDMGNELGFSGSPGMICVSNSALQANAVQSSVSCPGDSNGGFTLTVSGGTPPYNITWQLAGGGPVMGPGVINVDGGMLTVSNLPVGNYVITITDSSATPLVEIEQVEVLGPPMINLLFSTDVGLCNGDPGSITATVVLDSTPVVNPTQFFNFDWSNGGTTPTISNITSGLYTLTVTEMITGCFVTEQTFLPQPAPLVATITLDTASCSGLEDGIISVSVSGGTQDANGDYEIQLASLNISGTQANAMLQSGTYSLLVTDANGCTIQENIFLPAHKILSIAPTIQNVDCSGDCNGSILAQGTTSGGAPTLPYNFTWTGTPNPPAATDTPTNSTLDNLCIGTYIVHMQDPDGCEIMDTFSIIQPTPLEVDVLDVVNESCQPGMDGSITVGVTGGAAPFTYTWNTAANDSIATGLSAGLYTLNVTDVNNCFDTVSVLITVPDPPEILALENDTINCPSGNDGSLTVVPVDPASIASYDWTGGLFGPTINNLTPGEYIVTITDLNNCTAVDTGYVFAPPPLVLDSVSLTSPSCVGGPDGAIIIFVSGGTGPYNFVWSDPTAPNGNVFGFASAGDYTIEVFDANNCPPLEINVTLEDPPFIVDVFSAIDSVSCANTGMSCDGTATITASYSDGSTGDFNFIWLGSGEFTNNSMVSTAAQLCAGPQLVIVAEANGNCLDTFSVNIPAPPTLISTNPDIENVSCNGLADGSVTLNPSGGSPPYTIQWAGGVTGPTNSGLTVGTYVATITDTKGCAFQHTVTVVEPDPLVVSLDNSTTADVSCPGEEDGVIAVTVQGGNSLLGTTYIWQNGIAASDSREAFGLAAGTYSITVVDAKGCTDSLEHTIAEPPPIQFSMGEVPVIGCFGGNTSITVDSAWGGNPGQFRFRVDNGPPQITGQAIGGFLAGEHTITIFDVNGCETDTVITLLQPIEVQVELPSIIEIELGDSLTQLDPIIISSVPIDSFIWTPPNQLSCADCKNPRVNPIEDQLYTLVVIDANGCTGAASVLIDLDRNRNVYIPNIFSPNGDGINDNFSVYTGPGVSRISFVRLYDRWGELIHEVLEPTPSPDGTGSWDGTFKGDEMNPAVFLYLIEVEFLDGKVLLYRGDIALIR